MSPALAEDAQEGDVRFQSRRYAYVDGEFRVDPRRLPLQYQVLKGYEYGIADGELTAAAARDGAFTIPLSRWSAVADRGWYSGDIHIHHIAPKTCRLEMDAEDLNVANILTSDFTRDQAEFEGRLNAYSSGKSLIYVNQEFRSDHFGHMCLLNLKQLIEPVETSSPMRTRCTRRSATAFTRRAAMSPGRISRACRRWKARWMWPWRNWTGWRFCACWSRGNCRFSSANWCRRWAPTAGCACGTDI